MNLEHEINTLKDAMRNLADSLEHDCVVDKIYLMGTSVGHSKARCKKCSLCKSLGMEPNTPISMHEIAERDK